VKPLYDPLELAERLKQVIIDLDRKSDIDKFFITMYNTLYDSEKKELTRMGIEFFHLIKAYRLDHHQMYRVFRIAGVIPELEIGTRHEMFDDLKLVIERDRTIIATVFTELKKAVIAYEHFKYGRGSYEYDESIQVEIGFFADDIRKAIAPLGIIAWDKTHSPSTSEEVATARRNMKSLGIVEQDKLEVFGDWRDVRNTLEKIVPEWNSMGNEQKKEIWDFAQQFIDNFAPIQAKYVVTCVEGNHLINISEAYRCTDCKGYLCLSHSVQHFGQNHKPHE
jgi:hypothetical protein